MSNSNPAPRKPVRPARFAASRVDAVLDDDHNDYGIRVGRPLYPSLGAAITACETDAVARGNRRPGRWVIHDARTHRMSTGGITWRVIRNT